MDLKNMSNKELLIELESNTLGFYTKPEVREEILRRMDRGTTLHRMLAIVAGHLGALRQAQAYVWREDPIREQRLQQLNQRLDNAIDSGLRS